MNNYESVCILAPNITNEQVANMIVKIQNKIAEFANGEINIENCGKKKLAYTIKNNKEGTYLVSHFKAKSEDISKLERFYRITDEIIKFLNVRED